METCSPNLVKAQGAVKGAVKAGEKAGEKAAGNGKGITGRPPRKLLFFCFTT